MAIGRREFLVGLGSAGIGFGVGGFSHLFPLGSPSFGPDWSPGDERWVPSTCLLCPSHCGILGRVVDGSLVRIDGNPLHPVSRGGLCPKGQAGQQLLYHPSRLRTPLQRVGPRGSDEFEPIGWEEALNRVVSTLETLRKEGRSGELAWLMGDVAGIPGELVERFLEAYGSPCLMREDYGDGSEEILEWSQGVRTAPAVDLERADLVLSFGASLSEAWWCLPQAAAARAGAPGSRPRWIQIDTRLSRTAAASDEWFGIRPTAYGTLALSIIYVLLKEGLVDAHWIPGRAEGFEDRVDADGRTVPGLRTLALRHGRPDDLAPRIGLSVDQIVRIAKKFGGARRPVAVWDQAVSWRRGGLADAAWIHTLNLLKGSLNRAGGIFVPTPLPVAGLDGGREDTAPSGAAEGGGDGLRAADWAARIAGGEGPPVQALFLHQSNPVASRPGTETIVEALGRIPLVVSFSPFLDATARHADLVLPDHLYLERWQDAPAPSTVPTPIWGVVQPVVRPLHETRATGDVILQLAARLGNDVASALPWSSVEEMVRGRGESLAAARRGSAFVSEFRREELRELETRGWWLPHGQSPGVFWKSVREAGGWFDPFYDEDDRSRASRRKGGLIAFFPDELRRRIAASMPGLVEGFLPLAAAAPAGGGHGSGEAEDGSLLLMPYRVMTLASGGTALEPWLLEHLGVMTGNAWEAWVEINPETGRRLGLADGRRVRVVSEHGSFRARLRHYEGAQPGVLAAPYGLHGGVEGWEAPEPSNPLAAVGEAHDPATGLPDWYSTRVRLEAV